jgi:hypothetical protein
LFTETIEGVYTLVVLSKEHMTPLESSGTVAVSDLKLITAEYAVSHRILVEIKNMS